MSSDLKPCPHCGDQPTFSGVEHRDDNRYVAMELECCTVLTETIPWHTFKNMDDESIRRSLRAELVKSWNKRYEPEADVAAPVASLIPIEQPILGGVTSTLAKNEPESAETRMDTGVTRDVNRDELREAMQGLIDFCHDAGYDCQRAIKALATPAPAVIARPADQPQVA